MEAGKAAFEKWTELYEITSLLRWDKIPESAKVDWEHIARAAIEVYQIANSCSETCPDE